MNLIKDRWIPVKRADGTECVIAPWEIGLSDNPVTEITAPRPDFRGALYQFMIGLVQTAYAPEDDKEWKDRWDKTPSCEELRGVFSKFVEAFELVNEHGPAFMQDFNLPEKAEVSNIRSLLIDSPGANTVKNNLDHFVKRDVVECLCDRCVTTALSTLQINAPSGGQGHRTGMRGGGPLTTLIINEASEDSLWKMVWLNILTKEEKFGEPVQNAPFNIFPWMALTRESKNDIQTNPSDVNELQMYWGMPRRIRLLKKIESKTCSICGSTGSVWVEFKAINYGISYSSIWQHTLSPYRQQKEKDGSTSLIAIKGKQGGFSYPDWLSLTLGGSENEKAAAIVKSFITHKVYKISNSGQNRIWCFGYDMDNMKARCWYDQTMPLLNISEDKKERFVEEVQKIITAADEMSKLLQDQVKSALFDRPGDKKGDISFIRSAFWEETESDFYAITDELSKSIEGNQPTFTILKEWRSIIIKAVERIFDRFALQETDEPRNMKRVAEAAKTLTSILNSPKTKSLQILNQEGV